MPDAGNRQQEVEVEEVEVQEVEVSVSTEPDHTPRQRSRPRCFRCTG